VVGGSARSLGATARWPGATARPGRRGSGTGRQSYHLLGPSGTAHAGPGSDDSVGTALPPAVGADGR
jgi:hypothetical protein